MTPEEAVAHILTDRPGTFRGLELGMTAPAIQKLLGQGRKNDADTLAWDTTVDDDHFDVMYALLANDQASELSFYFTIERDTEAEAKSFASEVSKLLRATLAKRFGKGVPQSNKKFVGYDTGNGTLVTAPYHEITGDDFARYRWVIKVVLDRR